MTQETSVGRIKIMRVDVKKIGFPKVNLYHLKLNVVQRKELARVILDVAKTMFLTVVASYLLPPLIGFERESRIVNCA
ncbi:MAG: hypothetical protein FJ044_03185 [Candidatus Cloacimonetes bacterium]|nr:hypothetical protein [Candidatus Cloacimonadota bacterium]